MRLLSGIALAGLAASTAFAQSQAPAGTPPPEQSSPTKPDSSSDTGVSVDVGELVKGLIKAVRKPQPKLAAPVDTSAPAENAAAPATPTATEPARPIEAAIATPAPAIVAPAAVVPDPPAQPTATLAPSPAIGAPSVPRVTPESPPGEASPAELTTARSVAVVPAEREPAGQPAPQAGPVSLDDSRAPTTGDNSWPAWLMVVLAAIAIAAVAAVRFVRRQRILADTRAALALSPRLEMPVGGSRSTPLKLASPPITIRARLELTSAHG